MTVDGLGATPEINNADEIRTLFAGSFGSSKTRGKENVDLLARNGEGERKQGSGRWEASTGPKPTSCRLPARSASVVAAKVADTYCIEEGDRWNS